MCVSSCCQFRTAIRSRCRVPEGAVEPASPFLVHRFTFGSSMNCPHRYCYLYALHNPYTLNRKTLGPKPSAPNPQPCCALEGTSNPSLPGSQLPAVGSGGSARFHPRVFRFVGVFQVSGFRLWVVPLRFATKAPVRLPTRVLQGCRFRLFYGCEYYWFL